MCHNYHFRIQGAGSSSAAGQKGGKLRHIADVESIVYNSLGIGKENALSRQQLVPRTGLRDRQIREAIENLRHSKAILTLEKGNGYYIPDKTLQGLNEAQRWVSQQNRRINSIKKAQKGAKVFIEEGRPKKEDGIPGQISMFDVGGA